MLHTVYVAVRGQLTVELGLSFHISYGFWNEAQVSTHVWQVSLPAEPLCQPNGCSSALDECGFVSVLISCHRGKSSSVIWTPPSTWQTPFGSLWDLWCLHSLIFIREFLNLYYSKTGTKKFLQSHLNCCLKNWISQCTDVSVLCFGNINNLMS